MDILRKIRTAENEKYSLLHTNLIEKYASDLDIDNMPNAETRNSAESEGNEIEKIGKGKIFSFLDDIIPRYNRT